MSNFLIIYLYVLSIKDFEIIVKCSRPRKSHINKKISIKNIIKYVKCVRNDIVFDCIHRIHCTQ